MANNINTIMFKTRGKRRGLDGGLEFRRRNGRVVCALSRFDDLDHFIVARNQTLSFAEKGLL